MSLIACDYCDAIVDSDDDPYCFVDPQWVNRPSRVLCEPCRERLWDRQEERKMEDAP